MIVQTTEKIKEFTGINKNMSWETLKPFVVQAEEKYAKIVLGGLYPVLENAINTNTYAPGEKELLDYIFPMIANFTMYLAAPQVNIHISDLGFQENRSKEGTSTPASMVRYNDARLSFWRVADDYREFSYLYLQSNQSYFPSWTSSNAYSIYSQLLFRSNYELSEVLGMGNSVGTFLTLKSSIELSEAKYIHPLLCWDMFSRLKDGNKDNSLTDEEKTLLEKVKKALGWMTLYEAAPTLTAVMEDGVLVTAVPPERNKMFQPLSEEQINRIRIDAHAKGTMYLSQLKQFLDETADTYPLYKNSNCYNLRINQYELPNNNAKKSFGIY